MPLTDATILVLHGNSATAHALLTTIVEANADVVVADNAAEALHRLNTFIVDLAVIDTSPGVDAVVKELDAQGVPFIVFGTPIIGVEARVVIDMAQVVPLLAERRMP
jgi:DNA-binding response OmpR family regulator